MTTSDITWLTLPEVSDRLDISQREVRSLIRDNRLLASKGEGGTLVVDARQLTEKNGAVVPLPAMRGTLIMLRDAGYSSDEAQQWLLREEPELAESPMQALLDGKVHAVRRVISGLGF